MRVEQRLSWVCLFFVLALVSCDLVETDRDLQRGGRTEIAFSLSAEAYGTIKLYTDTGQFLRLLSERLFAAGTNIVQIRGEGRDGEGLASGVYVVRFDIGDFQEDRLIVLAR